MPRLDRIIDFMVKQQGTKFSMRNDENCYLLTPKGSRPLNQLMTRDEILQIVGEILPATLKDKFSDDCYLEFPFKSSRGIFAVQVERAPDSLQVTVLVTEQEVQAIAEPRRVVVEEAEQEPSVIPELTTTPEAPPQIPEQPAPPPARTESRQEQAAPTPAPFIPRERPSRLPGQYLENLLRYMMKNHATDLHLCAGTKPFVRIDGHMNRLDDFEALPHEALQEILWQVVPENSRQEFVQSGQTDFSQEAGEQIRLRCNVFSNSAGIGAVIRLVPRTIKPYDELGIPEVVTSLCRKRQGLILVTGGAGTGKSTTIASLLDFINRERDCHIITFENPIEFVHRSQKSLVNQRQIGLHVSSFEIALEAAFREDPDVVMADDLSDPATIQTAFKIAQTGRLVIGSLFTETTQRTIRYLIDQFPEDRQPAIITTLSNILLGVVSQTLCRKDEGGRVAAFEVLVCTPQVRDTMRTRRIDDIPSMIRAGRKAQMVSLNASLAQLAQAGTISPGEAYEKSVDKDLLLEQFSEIGIRFDPRAA